MFTHLALERKDTLATWLLPIVPPMVSAATGAGLIAHLPAGQDRLALLLACYAMVGISLLASLIIITLLWGRLAYAGIGPARTVPTLWIVLGPLGQSITAVGLLGNAAHAVIPEPYSTVMKAAAVLYGIPVWGFAIIWLLLAATITLRAARHHLPFSLTWWSFTFPVGTLVTGTSQLALHTHARPPVRPGNGPRGGSAVSSSGARSTHRWVAWLVMPSELARSSRCGRRTSPACSGVTLG
jgi:tellurite resistance protein TehA-like permease